jgi:tetratricopeptide (TPR) repeat protein
VLIAVDDLQWAEPTFLDLLEHLVDQGSGRIGLLVLARDELLEERPRFLEARSARVQLDGLAVAETEALVGELLGGAPLSPDVRARVFETAEGNPLFVEQLVALAAEGDTVGVEHQLPETIQALLAARLDRLGPGERAVLERAAVIGREFTAEHVTALLEATAVPTAARHLASLTRRAFVQVRSSGDYRFRHGLVQDATYRATPKKLRAELHERLADRLDREGEAGDALVGYHLERAYRLRTELASADRATLRLAEDAGRRLGLAGIRAWKRHDAPAASSLLGRAVDLLPDAEPRRLELLCELATVRKWTMDDRGAEDLLDEVSARARQAGSERLHLRAEIERAWPRFTRGEASSEEIVSLATRAIWVFEADGDDRAAGRAWIVLAAAKGPMQLRFLSCEDAAERALVHYERAGYTPCFSLIASAATHGPTPVATAIERCEALLASPTSDRSARAHLEIFLAMLETMRGGLRRARAHLTTSQAHVVSEGGTVAPDWVDVAARLSVVEGDTAAAARLLQEESARLADLGDHAWVATFAAALAEIACAEHRYDDALAHATRARDLAPASDLLAQVNWRRATAKAAVRLGEPEEARRLGTEACTLLSGSDALTFRADAALDLAEVLHLSSRHDEAAAPAEEALTLYEVKGDRTALERARRRRAELASLTSA